MGSRWNSKEKTYLKYGMICVRMYVLKIIRMWSKYGTKDMESDSGKCGYKTES